MIQEKFIHHETISAQSATEEKEAGWFDVIEEEDGPYVFDCGAGLIVKRTETVAQAIAEAQKLADAYDARQA